MEHDVEQAVKALRCNKNKEECKECGYQRAVYYCDDIKLRKDAADLLTAQQKRIEELEVEKSCEWFETDNDTGTWECGHCHEEWTLEAGSPIENDMLFCPHCGYGIKAINELEWHDEDEEWGYRQTTLQQPPEKGE